MTTEVEPRESAKLLVLAKYQKVFFEDKEFFIFYKPNLITNHANSSILRSIEEFVILSL